MLADLAERLVGKAVPLVALLLETHYQLGQPGRTPLQLELLGAIGPVHDSLQVSWARMAAFGGSTSPAATTRGGASAGLG